MVYQQEIVSFNKKLKKGVYIAGREEYFYTTSRYIYFILRDLFPDKGRTKKILSWLGECDKK